MIQLRALVAAILAVAPLVPGCASARPSAQPEPVSDAATPEAAPPGWIPQLREINLASRKSFGTSIPGSWANPGLSITIALDDGGAGRITRLHTESGVTSVTETDGLELLPNVAAGRFRQDATDFAVPGAPHDRAGAPRSGGPYTVTLPVRRLPTGLRSISGAFVLDVVETEEDLSVPLPDIEKPVDLAGGVRATLKLFDVHPDTRAPRNVVLEVASPAAKVNSQHVYSIELVDDSGNAVAALSMVTRYIVGDTLRRRYAMDGSSTLRLTREPPPKPVSAIRLRLFTEVRTIRIPFEFGPFDLDGAGG